MKLVELPDEVVATILVFLSPFEILNSICTINSNFHSISQETLIWKEFCETYWNYKTNETPLDSYFQIFKNFSKKFPNCLQCYKTVEKTCENFFNIFKEKNQKIYEISNTKGCELTVNQLF
jgi:hypothetical protein